jgi:hypothetical protein
MAETNGSYGYPQKPTVLIQRSVCETYIRALEAAHFREYQALGTLGIG